jgi:hypothetical protein
MKTTASLIAIAALLAACGSPAETPASPAEAAPAEAPAPQAAPEAAAQATPVSAAEEAEARAGESGRAAAFPVAYRGNWDFSGNEGCERAESGTRFVVTATQIRGYEDTSTLRAIEVLDETSIRVVLDNESSEGDHTLTQILRVSPVAGITLRIESGGRQMLATRCDPV